MTGRIFDERTISAVCPARLDDWGLDPYTFRVYMRVVRRGSGCGCYESVPKMAEGCKMSARKLRSCLQELCQLGFLRAQTNFDEQTKVHKPTTYFLLDIPLPPQACDSSTPNPGTGAPPNPGTGAPLTDMPPKDYLLKESHLEGNKTTTTSNSSSTCKPSSSGTLNRERRQAVSKFMSSKLKQEILDCPWDNHELEDTFIDWLTTDPNQWPTRMKLDRYAVESALLNAKRDPEKNRKRTQDWNRFIALKAPWLKNPPSSGAPPQHKCALCEDTGMVRKQYQEHPMQGCGCAKALTRNIGGQLSPRHYRMLLERHGLASSSAPVAQEVSARHA